MTTSPATDPAHTDPADTGPVVLPETQRLRRGHRFYPPADAGLPALYATEGVDTADKTVRVHYVAGGCDWWLVEYDPATGLGFGYACLGDPAGAEWGYIHLPELEAVRVCRGLVVVERDLRWTPRPVAELDLPRAGRPVTADLNSPHATTSTPGPTEGPAAQPRTENTITTTNTDAAAYTAGPADVESALGGVGDAGRAAAAAVAGYLAGSHTFALDEVDEVDEVTVDHLNGWVVTGQVGPLTDPRAQWRSGPGLKTFIVTAALDGSGAPTHRIEQSRNRSHTDVVENVTDAYRHAIAAGAGG